MSKRKNLASGAPWEDVVGYSRAVRLGNHIEITGTVAIDDQGQLVGGDCPYQQTHFILEKIGGVLQTLGATLADVVRTRMFVTDISRWAEYGNAHGEVFGEIRPCTTIVEVRRLIDERFLIEIEATAILSAD